MNTVSILSMNLGAVLLLMLSGWLISLKYRNVTVVDSLWGLGFVLIAWMTFLVSDGFIGRKLLIAFLTTIWGLRLSVYLTARNWDRGEDPRYAGWRKKSGEAFWWISLFKVFGLQAVFLWAIALSLQWGQLSAEPAAFTYWDGLGLTVWVIGFFFEAIGDRQLSRFKKEPANKGRVMDRGLWAYSRHPNYFGECLIWWGFFLIALATPAGVWTLISPILITAVLLKMTGVPLTEKTILQTRPGYREYIERTPCFFPWMPKKKETDSV